MSQSIGSSLAALSVSAYRRYIGCILVSFLGNLAHLVAATWLLLEITGNPASVPALFLVSAVPGVVLAPVVGRIVERYDQRLVLLALDVVQAGLVLTIPLAHALGALGAWQLYVQEFAIAFCGTVFFSATLSFVRDIVPSELLLSANSVTAFVYQLGNTLGALAGGLVVSIWSPYAAMVMNATTFLLSALGILSIGGRRFRRPRTTSAPVLGPGLRRELASTLRFMGSSAGLRDAAVLFLALTGAQRFLIGQVAPFVEGELGANSLEYGLIQGALAAGALVGGILIPALASRLPRGLLIQGVVPFAAATVIVFSQSQTAAQAAVSYLLVGVVLQFWAYYQTLIQHELDPLTEGRNYAVLGATQAASHFLVFLAGTVLTALLGIRLVYLVFAVILVVATVPSARKLARYHERRDAT